MPRAFAQDKEKEHRVTSLSNNNFCIADAITVMEYIIASTYLKHAWKRSGLSCELCRYSSVIPWSWATTVNPSLALPPD